MIEAMIENYLLVFLFTAIAAIVTNKLLAKPLILPLPEIQYPINSDPDFEISEGVLIKYKGTAAVVVIPEGVTSICERAFRNCTALTSITIGNSVTSIGYRTFYHCTGLTSMTILDSVTSIGLWAFGYCTGLTSITIPNSVTSIGAWAFGCCTGLTSITIPNSVTGIGERAFAGCTNLRHISVPGHFTDQQILDLRLPAECIIERRELAILPACNGCMTRYLNQNFNLVDTAVIERFRMFVFYSTRLASRDKLPFLPGDVWGVVLDQLRTVYLPSSEITKDILADTPDSQERKDKVAAYEQVVRRLLTHSPE